MSFIVLRQVTWTCELFIAQRAFMMLRLGVLLPPSHRPKDLVIVDIESVRNRTLHRGGGEVLGREDLFGGDTYSLSILVTD